MQAAGQLPRARSARAARVALLAITLAVATACATTYSKLPRQAEVKDLAALAEATAALPNDRGFVTVGEAGGRPVRLAYRHTRQAGGEWLVVLLHGLLSDSRTWRFVAGDVGQHHDLLAIDLMGCGRSDKPDPGALGPDGYSPTALARQVLRVIQERSKHERIAVVGHSLGGMVALRILGDLGLRAEFPEVLSRIERAVLISSVDFAVERAHPTFREIAKLSWVKVAVGDGLGVLRERVARSAYNGTSEPDRMPQEEVDRTVEILRDPAALRAAKGMIRQAVPFTPEERPDWWRIERLVADYRNVDVDCLILWGARDETFPASMGYKLRAQLPRARLRILPRRMHHLTVEAPHACAAHIRRFIAGTVAESPLIRDGVVDSVVGYPLLVKGGHDGNLGP
ncbi:MAG: alpha/beta fold hydrolase [Planctomycetota bacterium]|jgi:pimeloyl-ACP methyl ester carboxylesterase